MVDPIYHTAFIKAALVIPYTILLCIKAKVVEPYHTFITVL